MEWGNSVALGDAGKSILDQDLTAKRTYFCCDGRFFVSLVNSKWESGRVLRVIDTREGIHHEKLIANEGVNAWLVKFGVNLDAIRWWYKDENFLFDSELSKMDAANREKKQKFVYFILNPADQLVKIGISEEPTARLFSLQTANAIRLELLGFISGGAQKEREIQKKFSHLHVRGEWFVFGDEIRDFISSAI